jgi:hypothetical protein
VAWSDVEFGLLTECARGVIAARRRDLDLGIEPVAPVDMVKQLRPLRSATIINGVTQTFPPEFGPGQAEILDRLGRSEPGRGPAVPAPKTETTNLRFVTASISRSNQKKPTLAQPCPCGRLRRRHAGILRGKSSAR